MGTREITHINLIGGSTTKPSKPKKRKTIKAKSRGKAGFSYKKGRGSARAAK
jgi:hypothetical protein